MVRNPFRFLLFLLLAGCTTCPKYEATARSEAEGAMVTGSLELFPLVKVVVLRVDGKCRLGWDAQRPTPLLVDPGVRVLEVGGEYISMLPVRGAATVTFTVDLVAAHAYQLHIERDGRYLTFWIEDVTTGTTVTDRITKDAGIVPIVGGPGMAQ